MKAAVLERPNATSVLDADRLRAVVLTRIASAPHGISRAELAGDLAPLAGHHVAPAQWLVWLDGEVDALAAAELIQTTGARLEASSAGLSRSAIFLACKGAVPRSWDDVRDLRLVAKALGLERETDKRLKRLRTLEGLRAAVVQTAFNLKIKGVATPSRLRSALASVALERAFGNHIKGGLSGKLGLSAKAGRLLAAQLAKKPRDFGTDARLVAALAAEHAGASRSDLASLRTAILRRYLDAGMAKPVRPAATTTTRAAKPRPVPAAPQPQHKPQSPPPPIEGRPDLVGFVREVQSYASTQAQGWPGNRKAYISHVWHLVRDQRPGWGLSEIEFKCMLAEAHRTGQLGLAHADLKEGSNIKELQDSTVVYKNAVFHFIRVEG